MAAAPWHLAFLWLSFDIPFQAFLTELKICMDNVHAVLHEKWYSTETMHLACVP